MSLSRKFSKWWVLAILAIALFMINLDVTIVNIALPDIMTTLDTSLADVEWVINIYILIFAVSLILFGRFSDIFGRKRFFIGGLILFTLSSLACGLAPNVEVLIGARALQAFGGAAMMPSTLSLINVAFKDGQRGQAMGVWGAVSGAASALGPIIGGLLVDNLSWGYIFLVNIPLGIVAIVAAVIVIEESTEPNASRRMDWPGIFFATVALSSLTFALIEGTSYGWTSPLILSLFTVSAICFAAFLFIEKRSKPPLVDIGLFKNINFSAGNILNILLMLSLIGILFLLVLFLEIVLGFSAIKTGLILLPMPLAVLVVAPIAGKLADKNIAKRLLTAGMFITGVAIFLLSQLSIDTTWQSLVIPLALAGVGMGLVMAPVNTVILASVPVEKSGAASGIMSTTRQLGGLLGIALLGAVLQSRLVSYFTSSVDNLTGLSIEAKNAIMDAINNSGLNGNMDFSGISFEAQLEVMRLFSSAFADGLNTAMKVAAIFCMVGVIVSLLIKTGNNKTTLK